MTRSIVEDDWNDLLERKFEELIELIIIREISSVSQVLVDEGLATGEK